MCDLPDAKRVRRADLYSSSRSSSLSPPSSPLSATTTAALHAQLASFYGSLTAFVPAARSPSPPADLQTEHLEYHFRLFSSKDGDTRPQKISLDAEVDAGDGSFLKERDLRYFFADRSPGEKRMFLEAAISGEDVLAGLRKRARGLEVPWRVRVLKVGFGGQRELGEVSACIDAETEIRGKRKKPGKKRRIASRKDSKIKREEDERKKTVTNAREEAERQKRVRRNREKKLKRKAKERAKKKDGGDDVAMESMEGDASDE